MDLLTHPTAASGLYTDGNPGTGLAATVLTAEGLNSVLLEVYNAIDEAGLTHDGGDLTQLSQAIRTLGVGTGGLKNAVINADFAVWQRGTTFAGLTLTEAYTADRWAIAADGSGGAGIALVTRQGFTVGQGDVPGAEYFLRYQQTTASTAGGGRIRHKMEGLQTFAGRQVSVSLYLKASSALSATVRLVNVFGQGSTAQVASQAASLTTSWQLITFTATLPSVSGQSINAATAHLLLEIVLPQGTPLVDVARVQVERAALPSGFEFRPAGFELDLCRRYYEKSYEPETAPGTLTRKGISVGLDQGSEITLLSTRFRVAKRATPTMTWWNPIVLNATNAVLQANVSVAHTVMQTSETSRETTGWPVIGQSMPEVTRFFAHWAADAEI